MEEPKITKETRTDSQILTELIHRFGLRIEDNFARRQYFIIAHKKSNETPNPFLAGSGTSYEQALKDLLREARVKGIIK